MGLPVFTDDLSENEVDRMVKSAKNASDFLKAISHENRLMILCHLGVGRKIGDGIGNAVACPTGGGVAAVVTASTGRFGGSTS